jgi:hypothetical protein
VQPLFGSAETMSIASPNSPGVSHRTRRNRRNLFLYGCGAPSRQSSRCGKRRFRLRLRWQRSKGSLRGSTYLSSRGSGYHLESSDWRLESLGVKENLEPRLRRYITLPSRWQARRRPCRKIFRKGKRNNPTIDDLPPALPAASTSLTLCDQYLRDSCQPEPLRYLRIPTRRAR